MLILNILFCLLEISSTSVKYVPPGMCMQWVHIASKACRQGDVVCLFMYTHTHMYACTHILTYHTTIQPYNHTTIHTYIHTYTQENNRVERTFGDGTTRKRYSHIDLLCMIDGVETQKATVVAGSRCYYLKVAKLFLLQIPLLISCWLIFSKA